MLIFKLLKIIRSIILKPGQKFSSRSNLSLNLIEVNKGKDTFIMTERNNLSKKRSWLLILKRTNKIYLILFKIQFG